MLVRQRRKKKSNCCLGCVVAAALVDTLEGKEQGVVKLRKLQCEKKGKERALMVGDAEAAPSLDPSWYVGC